MKKRRLMKNKIWSVVLITLGVISAKLTNDGTFLVFSLFWGVPVFFSKHDCIM